MVGRTRRTVCVDVTGELVAHLLTTGTHVTACQVRHGVPEGAELVAVSELPGPALDRPRGPVMVRLFFEHPSLALVEVGAVPPTLAPAYVRDVVPLGPQCGTCGAPATLAAQDSLQWVDAAGETLYVPAGTPRVGCPAHPPTIGARVPVAGARLAEALLQAQGADLENVVRAYRELRTPGAEVSKTARSDDGRAARPTPDDDGGGPNP